MRRSSGRAFGQLVQRELQRRQRRGLVDDGADQLGDQRPLDVAPTRSAGSTMAASSSAGDIAGIVTVASLTDGAEAAGRASGRS